MKKRAFVKTTSDVGMSVSIFPLASCASKGDFVGHANKQTLIYFVFSLLCVAYVSPLQGQDWFESKSLFPNKLYTALPVAISDINGDLRDDVIILDKRRHLYIAYQNNSEEAFTLDSIADLGSAVYWSVVTADIDHNGERDIVLGTANKALIIYYQNAGTWRKESIQAPDVFGQAMNAVDINGDSWVDIFLCNDVGFNAVFINKNGILERDTTYFREIDEFTAEGNYGSVWSDYDLDGDLDLYIAKCLAATLPGDPRRFNILYENNGGAFENTAATLKLDSDEQSWTGDFLDVDNDGKYECLITNHDASCALLASVNDTFVDVSLARGFNFESTVIQNINEDFNQDGYIDIFLSGQTEVIYENLGDGSFNFTSNFFDPYYRINTGITGDLNYDGATDIYATYGELITGHSSLSDKVWINQWTENNYLDVHLRGTISNPDAIGARVQIYGSWGVQTKELKAGHSYGVQTSQVLRFGTGQDNILDSVVVYWPSGQREAAFDVPTENYLFFLESQMMFFPIKPQPNQYVICPGQEVELALPLGYPIQWSDGDTSRTRIVNTAGFYQASVHINQVWYQLPGHEVRIDDVEYNFITSDQYCYCENEIASLSNALGENVLWSNGVLSDYIMVDQSGIYSFEYLSFCGDTVQSDTVELQFKTPVVPRGSLRDTVKKFTDATLILEGENITWYLDSLGLNQIGSRDSLVINNILRDTCLYASATSTFQRRRDTIGAIMSNLDTTLNQVNRALYFEVNQPAILHSVVVRAETEGPRLFEIRDPRRRLVFSDTIMLRSGEQQLGFNALLIPQRGLFTLLTNDAFNRKTFGTPTPKLLSKNGLLNYPYEFENLITIYHSSFSTRNFDYFFDWDIEETPLLCESDLVKYIIVVDSTTSIDWSKENVNSIYPNPGDDIIHFKLPVEQVRIINQQGKMIFVAYNQQLMNVSSLTSGVYYVELIENERRHWYKWIKK